MARHNRFLEVDGLKTRYLEEGKGPAVILLHGASLGSSADVWERNLDPLAAAGLHVIAYDQPGFGLSDNSSDHSVAYRRRFILKFMDALDIHMAVSLAFDDPGRVTKAIVLGTGSLLPPLPKAAKQKGPAEGEEGTASEPTLDDTRSLLEHNLFNHSLITQEVLETRHRMSVGKNFQAFVQRSQAPPSAGAKQAPLWERLTELPVPLLMIFGRDDRASAGERAALLRERYPDLDLHIVDGCKHLVQWDAADKFVKLATDFLLR